MIYQWMTYGIVSPYDDLSKEITPCTHRGEVLQVGYFNAKSPNRQCDIFDFDDPIHMHLVEEIELQVQYTLAHIERNHVTF